MHARQAQLLDHFGGVAVAVGGIGTHDAAAFGVVRARVGGGAAFGRTDLDIDDDRHILAQQPGFDQRVESQVGGGGIAAHSTDVRG